MKKTTLMIRMQRDARAIEALKSIDGLTVDVLDFDEGGGLYAEDAAIDPARAADADILFCELPFANMDAFTNLKFIQISSAGYAQLYGLDLPQKNIRACNGRGVFDTPIGEWCAAMMVNLVRDMRAMLRNQEAGVFDRDARFQSELRGKRAGFFGYGSIAREAARLAKAMGMDISAYGRERADFTHRNYYAVPGTGDMQAEIPDAFYFPGQEDEFCKNLDFFIVGMPLTPLTEGIVGEKILRALPKGVFIINFARGPIIDETALLNALRDGHIGGAALDVHYKYPMPADHPLWRFPNVIMTPHISGSSKSTNFLPRIYDILTQNVKRYMDGRPLLNQLTEAQLNGG